MLLFISFIFLKIIKKAVQVEKYADGCKNTIRIWRKTSFFSSELYFLFLFYIDEHSSRIVYSDTQQ